MTAPKPRPVRLRLSRAKGFDLQAASRGVNGLDAVNVARPSRWGNPFPVGKCIRALGTTWDFGFGGNRITLVDAFLWVEPSGIPPDDAEAIARRLSVDLYRALAFKLAAGAAEDFETWTAPLRGRNLACWCAPGDPCHADVLLPLANPGRVV